MPTEAEWLRLYDAVRLMRATVGHDHHEPWPCPVVLVDEALAPILRAIPDRDYSPELAAIFLARLDYSPELAAILLARLAAPSKQGTDHIANLGEVIYTYGENDDTRDDLFYWVREDAAKAEIKRLQATLLRYGRHERECHVLPS